MLQTFHYHFPSLSDSPERASLSRRSGTNSSAKPAIKLQIINLAPPTHSNEKQPNNNSPSCLNLGNNAPSNNPLANSAHKMAAKIRSEEHTSELQSLRHLVCRL